MHVPEGREVQEKGRGRTKVQRQSHARTRRGLPVAGPKEAEGKWEGRVTGQRGQAL